MVKEKNTPIWFNLLMMGVLFWVGISVFVTVKGEEKGVEGYLNDECLSMNPLECLSMNPLYTPCMKLNNTMTVEELNAVMYNTTYLMNLEYKSRIENNKLIMSIKYDGKTILMSFINNTDKINNLGVI